MKKLLIFTITAAMLLSLTACAQSAKPDASLDTPAQEQTVSGSTQIGKATTQQTPLQTPPVLL